MLGEPVSLATFAGMALILASVVGILRFGNQ
jgi:drug/metabolite transporter (DMT)-like permease